MQKKLAKRIERELAQVAALIAEAWQDVIGNDESTSRDDVLCKLELANSHLLPAIERLTDDLREHPYPDYPTQEEFDILHGRKPNQFPNEIVLDTLRNGRPIV